MDDNTQPTQPATPPVSPPEVQVTATSKPASRSLMWGVVAALIVVILMVAGYFLLSRPNTPSNPILPVAQPTSPPQSEIIMTITPIPSPVITPLTTSNADQTLSNTDTSLQQAVNQVNMDLNDLNKVNSNLDNSAGL